MRGVGMERPLEDVPGPALLHQPAGIHDAKPVSQVGVNCHVVGHEQDRGSELLLDLSDQERTPFWTITSSAVVGSSAMMNSGLQMVASAMVTRCRIPPDNSCG